MSHQNQAHWSSGTRRTLPGEGPAVHGPRVTEKPTTLSLLTGKSKAPNTKPGMSLLPEKICLQTLGDEFLLTILTVETQVQTHRTRASSVRLVRSFSWPPPSFPKPNTGFCPQTTALQIHSHVTTNQEPRTTVPAALSTRVGCGRTFSCLRHREACE